MLKIRQCEGNGLGSCTLSEMRGKWNRAWMEFIYKIEGIDDCYCYKCVQEILAGKLKIEGGKLCETVI